MLPRASTSAERQSENPAPVRSRSSFTNCAGILDGSDGLLMALFIPSSAIFISLGTVVHSQSGHDQAGWFVYSAAPLTELSGSGSATGSRTDSASAPGSMKSPSCFSYDSYLLVST